MKPSLPGTISTMRISIAWLGLIGVLLTGCNRPADTAAPAGGGATAVGVTSVRAERRDVPVQLTATGTVTPLSSVDVKAQVTSVIKQVHIREGQFVRAGELLFTLDARTDEANLAKAKAQLARDEAGLADAKRQLLRSQELLEKKFVSQGAVDTNQALVDSQAAAVSADRAALDAAGVALSYARVSAPSAGRVGAISVFPGSAVQANLTTLVTITQLDPITVSFPLPQRHLPDALAALPDGGAAVAAALPDSALRLTGRLQFVDNAIDPASGTVKVKALFDNHGGQLWPGAFVSVSMTMRTLKDAVVIPQAAVIQSARGPIVYTIQDGKATMKPVEIIYAQGNDAAVSGVSAGDIVVLDGRQNLRPGVPVVERPREGPTPAPSGTMSGTAGAASSAARPAPK
jgi:RND family efflux transporter MFP subunit